MINLHGNKFGFIYISVTSNRVVTCSLTMSIFLKNRKGPNIDPRPELKNTKAPFSPKLFLQYNSVIQVNIYINLNINIEI